MAKLKSSYSYCRYLIFVLGVSSSLWQPYNFYMLMLVREGLVN